MSARHTPVYGRDNPPPLRLDGESVADYRVRCGWDAAPNAPGGIASQCDVDKLRPDFERLANKNAMCGLQRSRKGTYVNPAIARDWKWFQLGAIANSTGEYDASAAVDVHSIMRAAAAQQEARAQQLPTEEDCIRMMVQCRLRLLELGWREGEYAPRDGSEFTAINAGFRGPVTCVHLGSGFFVADGSDWWPTPRPIVFRAPAKTSGSRA